MGKSWPRQEGNPPSWVNFTERLYENKLTLLSDSRAGRTWSDSLALAELTRLGEAESLYGEKLALLGG